MIFSFYGLRDGSKYTYTNEDMDWDHTILGWKSCWSDVPVVKKNSEISDLWDYPVQKDCAFVYLMFETSRWRLAKPTQLYAKSAVYSALSMIRYTDVRDMGIPIYFLVSSQSGEEVTQYLKYAGVPDERVILFDQGMLRNYNVSMTGMMDESLLKYDWVIKLDADMYWYPNVDFDSFPVFSSLLVNDVDYILTIDHVIDMDYQEIFRRLENCFGMSEDGVWSFLDRMIGRDVRSFYKSDKTFKPDHGGFLTGFSRAICESDDFFYWFYDYGRLIFTDYLLLNLWLVKEGVPPVSSIASPRCNKVLFPIYYWNYPFNVDEGGLFQPVVGRAECPYELWSEKWLNDMKLLRGE